MFKFLLSASIMLISVLSIGQTLVTDRPTQSVSTEIIPKGGFQFETGIGVELTQREGLDLNNRSFILPTSLFRLPLLNTVEFRIGNTLRYNKIETNNWEIPGQWQIDDLQVGFKWKLTNGESSRTQIALMSHAVLPTGSQESVTFGVINKILVSKSHSNGISTGYNIGYDYFGSGNGDLTFAVNIVFPVHKNIGFYIEPYGAYSNFENLVLNADAGMTFLLNDRLQLDYSFGLGLNNRMNYQALGFSMLFNK